MMFSRQIALPLVALSGIAVYVILRIRRIHLHLHKVADRKDCISELPDEVLISIISRLPIKSSVKTSILSKRWLNLYKHVLDIAITCCDLHDTKAIAHDVKKYLMLRSDTGSRIRSFHLRCFLSKSYLNRLKQSIYSLGKLGVEELVLHFSHPSCGTNGLCECISLCDILAEMQSLKYFKLDSCSLQPNLKSQCNSLQTLSLTSVAIYPGALDCILSNCSSLCSLSMECCECPSKLCFKGHNLLLKSLIVKDCEDVEEMEFYASNLIEFKFEASRFVNFVFEHVPLLQSIDIVSCDDRMISYVFGGLSRDLPHLHSLAFSPNKFVWVSLRHLWTEKFGNLRSLQMGVYCTSDINLLELASFMGSCPLLQEFYVWLFYDNIQDDAIDGIGDAGIVHPNLKKVEIHGFKGKYNAMGLISYLLETAINLEQMHIFTPRRDCERTIFDYVHSMCNKIPWHKKIEKQLQSHAVSKTAQVTVEEEDWF